MPGLPFPMVKKSMPSIAMLSPRVASCALIWLTRCKSAGSCGSVTLAAERPGRAGAVASRGDRSHAVITPRRTAERSSILEKRIRILPPGGDRDVRHHLEILQYPPTLSYSLERPLARTL